MSTTANSDRTQEWQTPLVILGGLLVIVPLLAIAGWEWHVSVLKRLCEGMTPMNPLTALCFAMLGSEIANAGRRRDSVRISSVVGVAISLFALWRLSSYLFGFGFPADTLMFHAELVKEPIANRMAWSTALCFLCSALPLIGARFKSERGAFLAQGMSAFIGVISLFAISGYLLGIISNRDSVIPMALNTSILFGLLCAVTFYRTKSSGFLQMFAVADSASSHAKRLMVFAACGPLAISVAVECCHRFFSFSLASGEAVLVTSMSLLLSALVWHSSLNMKKAEHQKQLAAESDRKNRTFLRQVVDATPNLVSIKDNTGRIVLANKALASFYGVSPDDMIGQCDADYYLKPDELEDSVTGDRWVVEHREQLGVAREALTDRFGAQRTFQSVKVPIQSPEGCDLWILGVSTDITRRVEAEDEAQSAAREARDLYDRAPCGYHTIDSRGIVVEVNDTELDWLGYSREEIIGKAHITDLLSLDSSLNFEFAHEELRKVGFIREVGAEMRRKDGTTFPAVVNSRALFDSTGAFMMARTTIFDNSQRKAAEEIALEAKAEAERANRAKSEFLSRMSHELRTPLNSILGFAQLLELQDLPERQKECTEQILRGGRHLLQLINEVLDIARIESGHGGLSIEPVEVHSAVLEAVNLIAPIASSAGIAIEVVPIEEGLFVEADRQKLIQVLLNLLSNAVKYNKQGGYARISAERLDDGKFAIRVRDTGIGVNESDARALFEPFARLDAADRGIEGTGLGLALSRGLATQMGGSLDYESNPDGGSIFCLRLLHSAHTDGRDAMIPIYGLAGNIELAESMVLLIEDNKSNITLIKRILASRPQLKLGVAMKGRLGIELAMTHLPDLILLDLHLPDIHGEEVLRALRAEEATRDIPILVTSADATPRQADKMLSLGATGYLTKPLEVVKLLSLMDHLLGGERKVA